ncbi:GNAT family N-acetyltransferase [Vibrio ostreicida]|uniref:GNAT family N-acetyltransferase n=1 Tax=Vibrio ostreicida TaxID=526588 RepID=UPI000970F26C|nr:GNAT family N-acetyltransferase [Vibrio ostreicida]
MTNELFLDKTNALFRIHLTAEYDAIVRFEIRHGIYCITSTKVPQALQGMGYGKVMMRALLPELERMEVKIEPLCSYVAHYLEKHPEWSHLVAQPTR